MAVAPWAAVAGAGLLAAAGAIHLDLYLTGYRTIPTIGWLFLLQVIAAFGLATAFPSSGADWTEVEFVLDAAATAVEPPGAAPSSCADPMCSMSRDPYEGTTLLPRAWVSA